jgi:hypothetical protein
VRPDLDFDLGCDLVLHDAGDDAGQAVTHRLPRRDGAGRGPVALRQVLGEGLTLHEPLPALRASRLDHAGIRQPPDRVGAHAEQRGRLADLELVHQLDLHSLHDASA